MLSADLAAAIPASLHASRLSPTTWTVLGASLGCGMCAYAGLYPCDNLGVLVGVTTAALTAVVTLAALGARTRPIAVGRAVGLSVLLGAVNALIAGASLGFFRGDVTAFSILSIAGALTGLVYSVPLAILVRVAYPHARSQTWEAGDRAARITALWLVVGSLVAAAWTILPAGPARYRFTPGVAPRSIWFTVALTGCAGIGVAAIAHRRLRLRALWIARVRAGEEPAFRLRACEPRDSLADLPRLSGALGVIEWRPTGAQATAYRDPATGCAVALVAEIPLTERRDTAPASVRGGSR